MKKRILLLVLAATLLLSGCRKDEPEPTPKPEQPPEKPTAEEVSPVLKIDELHLEISRGTSSTEELASVVRTLPGWLENCFAEAENLEIGRVKVSVGTAPATTAQSLAENNIHLAFLPAEDFLQYGGTATALYGDADSASDSVDGGARGLICSTPTVYGTQLAQRASGGKPLSWNEVSRARWGVLAETSASCRGFVLWLADQYDASISDLPKLTVYKDETALFYAAATGEIDALVIPDDARTELAEFWMHPSGELDEEGGFGRTDSIWNEIAVLDVTERLYSVVLAAAPEQTLADERFVTALEAMLEQLMQEKEEVLPVLGAQAFVSVEEEILDATARLTMLEK